MSSGGDLVSKLLNVSGFTDVLVRLVQDRSPANEARNSFNVCLFEVDKGLNDIFRDKDGAEKDGYFSCNFFLV